MTHTFLFPFAIALGLSAVLMVLNLRLPTSQISGFAETRFVSLTSKRSFVLGDIRARNLGVSFVGEMRLPDGTVFRDQDLSFFVGDATTLRTGFTSVPGFEIPAETHIVMEISPLEQRAVLRIVNTPLVFSVLPAGGAHLSVDAEDCETIEACMITTGASDELTVTARSDYPIVMQFDIPKGDIPIATRIAVSSLEFWDTRIEDGRVEKDSGLVAGRVRFKERPNSVRDFDPAEIVAVTPSNLSVRGILFRGDRLVTPFSGGVKGFAVEIGDAEHSLMPTLFDALANNNYVKFVVALVSLFVGAETLRNLKTRISRRDVSSIRGDQSQAKKTVQCEPFGDDSDADA